MVKHDKVKSEETIGARLRKAVAERGLSMLGFATSAGIPYRSLQNYAADEQKPGADVLVKIKETLGISIDWLLTGSVREGGPLDELLRDPVYRRVNDVFNAIGDFSGAVQVFLPFTGLMLADFGKLDERQLREKLGDEQSQMLLRRLRDLLTVFLWRRNDPIFAEVEDIRSVPIDRLIELAQPQVTRAVQASFANPWEGLDTLSVRDVQRALLPPEVEARYSSDLRSGTAAAARRVGKSRRG